MKCSKQEAVDDSTKGYVHVLNIITIKVIYINAQTYNWARGDSIGWESHDIVL